jgi:hypothetical protein
MKRIAISLLGLVMYGVQAAEPAAPAANAPPASIAAPGAGAANGQSVPPSKEALQQAFDGAMTCSALSAIISQSAKPDDAWRWKNRSFAFGMLAANFYVNATQVKLSNEELDNALTSYANSLQAMSPKDREPFDTGCARKYAQIDKLCEVNHCPNAAPGSPEFVPPAGAPAATPAK